ncbi:hypothetical protein NLG97_g5628 [Lecanicillium saksenae]|uniref:Uncharacterized protein n=1 Tax=Lecanicillium saksenae TaxID=468837 RepID=A0ACC1QUH5_9HYPO|nr:hypothetical protein NLG97_g5628 [Lecanicillium saksenae]
MFAAHVMPLLVMGNSVRPDVKALASTTLLFLSIFISSITPRDWITPIGSRDARKSGPSQEETASWLDYWCTFGRLTPLITRGWDGNITTEDLASLPWNYQPKVLLQTITHLRQKHRSTARTLYAFLWLDMSIAAVSASLFFITELIKPLGMYYLLDYLANPAEAVFHPYLWLLVIMFGKLFGAVVQQQLAFHSGRASLKLQIALTSEIYNYSMKSRELDHDFLSSAAKGAKRSSTGLLTNLISTDVKTIMQGRILIMVIFGGPVGGIIGLVSLYKIVGWPCLLGLAITLLGTPITAWISRYASDAEETAKDAQDARISLSTEYFRSIKIVKYFAWEDSVASQMEKGRDDEQRQLWKVGLLSTMSASVAYIIPSLALVVVFALYSGVQGHPMTASIAFITIDLMEIIRDGTTAVSTVGRMSPKIQLSMKRIDRYIAAVSERHTFPEGDLRIQDATFRRTTSAEFKLRNISIDFVHGGLNVVVGQSGSGKTSLLLSILGETVLETGSVSKPTNVAFAPQSPWLQSKSFRDNILFTSVYNATRYWRVIKACCLDVDLEELPDGDMTNIGENGQLLSGGQRARLSLARALLSDAPLLLLDDIFSALDSTTSISVWNNVFCSSLLDGRTVVLVTQVPWIAAEGDCVVTMKNGSATPATNTVNRQPKSFANPNSQDISCNSAKEAKKKGESDSGSKVKGEKGAPSPQIGCESRFQWIEYISYFGTSFTIAMTSFSLVIFILAGMASELWLTSWVDIENRQSSSHATAYYLRVYVFLSLFTIFSDGVTNLAFMRGSWAAAGKLHSLFVHAVLNTSIGWLENTSLGHIMGRLSSDIDSLDQNVSEPLREFLDEALKAIMMLGAITGLLPLIVAPAIILSGVGALIGEAYSRAIKLVKKIASSAQAPVISRLSETMDGMVVIRARTENVQSAFDQTIFGLLYSSARAAAAQRDCDQWLKFRMSLLSALINVLAGVFALRARGSISAGLVGFSLAQASSLSNGLLRLIFKLNELNISLQSFHRVKEYCDLPPEEETCGKDETPNLDPCWPQSSRVEFRNVTVRYSLGGADVLKNVILSLLRFTHIVSGTILYDGVDITTVPRKKLRQAIGMVPQDALLFQGTIRINLDPSNSIPESELSETVSAFASLGSMRTQTGEQDGLTLDTPVSPDGNNFSHGQRQVLSLCRAVVRKTKLTILDEATSSVDSGTDCAMQDILRTQLRGDNEKGSGLITVAHRLKTILDYDKVLVLGFGEVLEIGSPKELLSSKGKFYDMVKDSGGTE